MITRNCYGNVDFPDAFRANMWVRDLSNDKSVHEALSEFKVRALQTLLVTKLCACLYSTEASALHISLLPCSDFPDGCGGTPKLQISCAGCAHTT